MELFNPNHFDSILARCAPTGSVALCHEREAVEGEGADSIMVLYMRVYVSFQQPINESP